jgi:hypothetical protein
VAGLLSPFHPFTERFGVLKLFRNMCDMIEDGEMR